MQERGDSGVPAPPQLQRGKRLVVGLDAGNLDQRLTALRRLLRRTQFLGQLKQLLQGPDVVVHQLPRITEFGEPGGHGVDGERLRPAAGHLVPSQRRGHPRIGRRPHRVRRRHGAVLGVLIEVDEHALALLLPPVAGGQSRCAPFDLAGDRLSGQTHLRERPPRGDTRVDVESAGARRLGPRRQPVLFENLPHQQGDVDDLLPGHPGHRVEVDAQFIGVIQIRRPDRMRIEVDAAQVHRPHQSGSIGDHRLPG